ncbi:MAG: hypothetical protein JWR08_1692 [Enterovirga sp.]|nr:hypothetical protein [Enterovirga sp.]
MRVLILEDDPLTALDLQIVVESCGHDVVSLCDTVAAARRHASDDLDFAFLDIDLPDGKSFDFAARLAERQVPFAFVSASSPCELPGPLRHMPFIAKPYHHAAIRHSLG